MEDIECLCWLEGRGSMISHIEKIVVSSWGLISNDCPWFKLLHPFEKLLVLGMRCGTMRGGVLWCSSIALDVSNTQSFATGFDKQYWLLHA